MLNIKIAIIWLGYRGSLHASVLVINIIKNLPIKEIC